jgi:sn-glycerol 3-phosphate transport system permease protein
MMLVTKEERQAERAAMREERKIVRNANRKHRNAIAFTLFLAPATLAFLIFVVWPVLYNIYLSFLEWNMVSPDKEFVGFANYLKIFTDAPFLQSLRNSGVYILILLISCMIFPYFISFAMVHLVDKGQQVYRSILFFPSLVSLAVCSVVMSFVFNFMTGPVNALLKSMGIRGPNWLNTGGYILFVIGMVATWKIFGYNLIIFLAAILEVPVELIEAAKLEKASKFKIFWRIIFPLTSSTAFYVFVITFSHALSYVFTPISVITAGGPNYKSTNVVYQIYEYAFKNFQSGRAAAAAIFTLILVLFVVILYQALEKKVHYEN